MSKQQTKLVLLAAAALGLILPSAFAVQWFKIRIGGPNTTSLTIDLRSMTACAPGGCLSASLRTMQGFYPTAATATFWASLAVSLVVALQAMSRIFRGFAPGGLSRLGYVMGVICIFTALGTGFLFAPDTGTGSIGDVAVSVTRTWAPVMMLGGVVLALIALQLAVAEDSLKDSVDMTSLPQAVARVSQAPAPVAPPPKYEPRKRAPSSIPLDRSSAPDVALDAGPATITDHALHGKLSYVAATVESSRAGLDARREDGVAKLVMWTDVVGVVARRLPAEPPYDGETFVDIVSSAGSTLRIVPWTRWSGDALDGDGEDRARAIVHLVASRCPGAALDAATRAFFGGHGHAAQLSDLVTLAQHDERLA